MASCALLPSLRSTQRVRASPATDASRGTGERSAPGGSTRPPALGCRHSPAQARSGAVVCALHFLRARSRHAAYTESASSLVHRDTSRGALGRATRWCRNEERNAVRHAVGSTAASARTPLKRGGRPRPVASARRTRCKCCLHLADTHTAPATRVPRHVRAGQPLSRDYCYENDFLKAGNFMPNHRCAGAMQRATHLLAAHMSTDEELATFCTISPRRTRRCARGSQLAWATRVASVVHNTSRRECQQSEHGRQCGARPRLCQHRLL
jgi:hypothetical protein